MYRNRTRLFYCSRYFYVVYFCKNNTFPVVLATDMATKQKEKEVPFGKRLAQVRKDKKMSQDELAKKIGVHGAVIGRYERDEVKPSIETAAAIAQALEVSLDYLVGSSSLMLDTATIKRVEELQQLNEEDKKDAFRFLDLFLRDAKARHAYAR